MSRALACLALLAAAGLPARAALSIKTSSLPGGTVGQPYSASIQVTGAGGSAVFALTIGSLPPGLSLDSSGNISGTPTAAGTFTFIVAATDGASIATARLSITVAPADPPLQIVAATLPSAAVGAAYSATLSATGGTPPYTWSVSSGSPPAGLSLSASGQISGTPTAAGTSTFGVVVTDADSRSAAGTVVLTVAAAPAPSLQVTTSSLPGGTVGAGYSATLGATGGTPPYQWSVSSGSLPAGLNLNGSGQIGGTPSAAGNTGFTVQVTDSAGAKATAQLSISVAAALAVTTSSLPAGVVGNAYSAALGATGGTPPYQWSVSSGSLPAGLNLNASSGQIGGTPSAAGNAGFTVQVTDSAGAKATAQLGISIAAALAITTTSLPAGVAGSAYSATLAASGGTPPYQWSVSSGSLPAGLNLNASSGQIGGTPSAAGNAGFTVQVADSAGAKATAQLGISIAAALAITTTSLPAGVAGSAYSATLAATGGTPPYQWSVTSGSLPAGLNLNASSGQIGGTPSAAGNAGFTVQVADSAGAKATAQLGISVAAGLAITSNSLPAATVGTAYSATLTASGGTPPYTWAVSSGALPAGLSLNGVQITGTPQVAGTGGFTVQVTDSTGATATAQLSIAISQNLSITTGSLPGGTTGQSYSQTLAAAGGTAPYSWSVTAGALPGGLNLASGGQITGTPNAAGAFNFTVQVTDATGATATKALAISITAGLGITTAAQLPAATASAAYSQTLAAQGGTPPYTWTVASGALPAGLSLNGNGSLSGTPTAAGDFTFSVQVADSANQTATKTFTLTVAGAVTITTASLPSTAVGAAYSEKLAAQGGTPPYTWTISAGSLPGGLTLDNGGTLSGKAASNGDFTFTVKVTDSSGATATKQFTLTVNQGLSITTASPLPSASVGAPYSQMLTATAGTAPYSWSISQGSLPAGLTLNSSSGVISGSPTQTATTSFTVQVRDAASNTATKAFDLTVTQGPSVAGGQSLPPGVAGHPYSGTLAASGGTMPFTWSITAGALPTGISLNAATGALTGTPQAAGDFSFTAQVTDSTRATSSSAYTLHIGLDPMPAFTITGMPDNATPLQQPQIGITLAQPYPIPISGQIVLSFQPDAALPADDPSIQFSTGGRTAGFTVPANTTTANFNVAQLAFQTGSVSGTITATLSLQAGGVDATPKPAPSHASKIARSAPVIRTVTLVQTGNGFEIHVTGYSPPREMTQAAVHFNGSGLQGADATVSLADAARQWFQDVSSQQFGSQFTLVLPFNVQGDKNTITGVSVTLSNTQGTSAAAGANF